MRCFTPDGRDFDQIYDSFRFTVPARYNLGVDLCAGAGAPANAPALVLARDCGPPLRMSFGDLRVASDRFANALVALGVERGDRVAIVLPQRAECVIAHIAIYKLGAVALPLSILFGHDALEYRLADSGAAVAITDGARFGLVQEVADRLDTLGHVVACDPTPGATTFQDLLDAASDRFAPADTAADDPALLIYTSGTTGPPKGALNAHRCLLGNLPGFELSQDFFPRHGDLMWTPADWAWTGGLLDALAPALHYGVPVLGHDGGRFDPERALDLIARHAVRNAFIPPTALKMMMQVPGVDERRDLRLRSITSAGEQVGPEVLRWATRSLGVGVNEMWGQTEFNYLAGNSGTIMDVRPGSMGKPYPGHRVTVLDAAGAPLPAGAVGQLAAYREGDPVGFLGYWRNPAATDEKCLGPWWLTGDTGYADDDGYLWFVGRNDDVISSAGHRIGPGEVEDALLKHPAIAEAAVIGSPDPLRGEIIKAYVVLADGHTGSAALIGDIQASVKGRLAAHEYPRVVEFLDALPLTTTGKIRRVDLRARDRAAR